MRYAESKLLCGEIIDAGETDDDTYKELLLVCPASKNKVRLLSCNLADTPEGKPPRTLVTFVYSEKIPNGESRKFQEKNKYFGTNIDVLNDVARVQRINLLKPNLLEIIKSSAILDQPVTLDGLGNVFNDGLTRWFIDFLYNLTSDESYPDRIKSECQNLYDSCVKKTLRQCSDYFSDKETEHFTSHNHIVYGSKIASELLEYAMVNFCGKDRKALMYLVVNEEIQEFIYKAASQISLMARSILRGKEREDFQKLWIKDKYQGMNEVEELARISPEFRIMFDKYKTMVALSFTINLCLIFWFVPWLDELKKLNQQSKPNNIC